MQIFPPSFPQKTNNWHFSIEATPENKSGEIKRFDFALPFGYLDIRQRVQGKGLPKDGLSLVLF